MRFLPGLLALGTLLGCAPWRSPESGVNPPTVLLRDIANMERVARGVTVELATPETLFIPEGFTVPAGEEIHLTMHFHGTPWFVIEEHWRRGATTPLFIFSGFEGSSAYRRPYEDRDRLARNIRSVQQELARRYDRPDLRVTSIELQSYSAGYGAIREIVKSPEYVDQTTAIVLADSMYASFTSDTDHRPLRDHVSPWFPIARRAMAGDMLFVVAHSSGAPRTYAGTTATARAVVESVGGELQPVRPGSLPSADPSLDFPLITRFDRGGLHVWGYAGDDLNAHMAQARTLADFWRAVENSEATAKSRSNINR